MDGLRIDAFEHHAIPQLHLMNERPVENVARMTIVVLWILVKKRPANERLICLQIMTGTKNQKKNQKEKNITFTFSPPQIRTLPFHSRNGKKLGVSSYICNLRKSLPYENPDDGILYHSRLGALLPSGEGIGVILMYIVGLLIDVYGCRL